MRTHLPPDAKLTPVDWTDGDRELRGIFLEDGTIASCVVWTRSRLYSTDAEDTRVAFMAMTRDQRAEAVRAEAWEGIMAMAERHVRPRPGGGADLVTLGEFAAENALPDSTVQTRVRDHNSGHERGSTCRIERDTAGRASRAVLERWGMGLSKRDWRRRSDEMKLGECGWCDAKRRPNA